jgi:hypothetical protein
VAGIGLLIDPVGEDASNVPLDLNDGIKFRAMKASYPTPPRRVNWVSSADTEGAEPSNPQYDDRTITIECRVYGSSASDLQTQIGFLLQKVARANEEKATHEYISPSGAACVFDLLEGAADYELDNAALANKRTVVTITFTAKPFWRSGLAREVAGEDHKETALPCVTGIDIAPAGDVPALGRLVIDDDQGQDQWTLIWGLQSRYYDPTADAALFYEAESRTPQGGAATAELAGASGAGKNTVLHGSLVPNLQSVLSTQAVGAGNHLRHVGSYRVFARLQRPATNVGSVSVALQWAQGDFQRATENDLVTWLADELEGIWLLVDLGLVHLERAVAGTQRWEGRILASSTVAGDDLYVDCLMLFPVDEGYGTLKVVPPLEIPTQITAHDEFDQAAGNLDTPKALPLGGSWSEQSKTGANGFQVEAVSHTARRSTVSDADLNSGCFAIAGATVAGPTQVSVEIQYTAKPSEVRGQSYRFGVFARFVDLSNWAMAVLEPFGPTVDNYNLTFVKRVAGTTFVTVPGHATLISGANRGLLTLRIDAAGNYKASLNDAKPESVVAGQDADLAASGALATGKFGIYDAWASAVANTRIFDNFLAFAASASDAAVYASRSAEVRSDRMLRFDPGGTILQPRRDYSGKYLRLPPARREGRSVRTIVKLSRGNIDTMADRAIDDASFRLFWQPRGLVLPES